MKTFAEQIAMDKWNANADQNNQWDNISQDERDELIDNIIPLIEYSQRTCPKCLGDPTEKYGIQHHCNYCDWYW